MQTRQIIAECRMRIYQVVQILDFCNGAEAAHSHSDSLSNDCCFTYSGIGNTMGTIFFIHSPHSLIHIAQFSGILPKSYQRWVFAEKNIEIAAKDFRAVYFDVFSTVVWRYGINIRAEPAISQ